MTKTRSQRPWALTKDDVSAILKNDLYRPERNPGLPRGHVPIEVRPMDFSVDFSMDFSVEGQMMTRITNLNALQTKARIERWCQDTFALVAVKDNNEHLGTHFERLDALFSTLMTCNFMLERHQTDKATLVDDAYALLQRLPRYPPELTFGYKKRSMSYLTSRFSDPWPSEYFLGSQEYKWINLRVLSRPCTNVVRRAFAMSLQMLPKNGWAETIVSILDTVTSLQKRATKESDARAWFIIAAFFWSAWQSTVMLELWLDARGALVSGYAPIENYHIVARETPSIMPPRASMESLRPRYMCKWAFELLRADLASLTQDFRTLFAAYERQFGSRASRCNAIDSDRVCDGKTSTNCERFQSDRVEDQSAHDSRCPGPSCSLLTWDEQSFMSVKGARAVCLETTDDKHIRYRPISGENMAISHVWSHGQGGRPETGFNICLHRRYTKIAQSLGCMSYWMDTPCVPTDDKLRDEAIGQINDNFIKSKLVLLIDRDLMEIDIDPPTLAAKETILATLVVCDWNVRAWTLLEGIRGRANLHILCKDNRVIPLSTILPDIISKSCLSLVSPCLAIQHYTRTRDGDEEVLAEYATCFLNHRHPTKDRDIITIWSLVCGSGKVVKTAEAFWKAKIGEELSTGFLISSSPRIKGTRGLSWAPERPNLVPPVPSPVPNGSAKSLQPRLYPAFSGENSRRGTITSDGLEAEWLVCRVRRLRAGFFQLFGHEDRRFYNAGGNEKMELRDNFYLRSVVAPAFKRYCWVSLLLPVLAGRGGGRGFPEPLRPFKYQGECKGLMMAIVATNDDDGRSGWEWQSVHEWDEKFRLPEFMYAPILIA